MILADCHMHSLFSGDSEAPLAEQAEAALAKGLETICITDHEDLFYPEIPDGPSDIFDLDIPAYQAAVRALRDQYAGKLNIRTGIELGLAPQALSSYRDILEKFHFDFVLGSIHVVDGYDIYYPDYWREHPGEQGLRRYFECMLEQIRAFDNFDSLSHLDYAARVLMDQDGNPVDRHYRFSDFSDVIDPVLRWVIDHDKALEVNTAGYKYGLGVPNPQPEVLSRYRELGGEKITIGSDGHRPEHIAYDFKRCEDLLTTLGFRYYWIYQDRTGTPVAF